MPNSISGGSKTPDMMSGMFEGFLASSQMSEGTWKLTVEEASAGRPPEREPTE